MNKKIRLGLFTALFLASCGGNSSSPLGQMVGSWNANAYHAHKDGSSLTIWLKPTLIEPSNSWHGHYRVVYYTPTHQQTEEESGEFTGELYRATDGSYWADLVFPVHETEPQRTLRVSFVLTPDQNAGEGQATGVGFDPASVQTEYFFSLNRSP